MKKKEKSDAEKIGGMVNTIIGVVVAMLLYLVYDIATAVGVVRHIHPPLCGGKNTFLFLINIMQVVIVSAITYVFPVKKPDQKGKTGQMGTTKVESSTSTTRET